jgi:hypothetical protein
LIIVPVLTVPTATGTMIKVWSDRALDTYRLSLTSNRPAVAEAMKRVGGYYQRRGLNGQDVRRETGTAIGTFATVESVAVGFQGGLRFLSLMMLALGVPITLLLWQSARGLRAPPGAGYT